MKADCFFLIFNSPHIVDKIRSHFPKYIKHTETILSNCHIPSGSLNYLSYDEFLIYCAFYFNYQDILVNNDNIHNSNWDVYSLHITLDYLNQKFNNLILNSC